MYQSTIPSLAACAENVVIIASEGAPSSSDVSARRNSSYLIHPFTTVLFLMLMFSHATIFMHGHIYMLFSAIDIMVSIQVQKATMHFGWHSHNKLFICCFS